MTDHDLKPSDAVLSASQALRFLADAGEVLSSSLDYGQTLRGVAQLAVPELADWCAVFLTDEGGLEDEITSRHPDPELEATLLGIRRRRRDVDGASESRRVARTAEPILAHDVRRAADPDLDAEQRRLVTRLAPRSYMVVPMVARGRSIGSLTLLSTREGRHYTTADLAFAETLAARCALAIDNARLHDAAERSLSLLDTVFATAPVGLAFVDPDLRFVRVNEAMAAFNGRAVQEHLGRTIPEVLGEPAAELAELYRRVLDTGRPLHDLQLSGATAAAPDDVRHFNVSCTPVHGPAGDLLGVSAVVLDVTDHQRSLEAERDARARADFLARAGGLLDESLDYERTLRAVADIAVPDIADWCAVSVLDELGALQQVAAAHVDPAQRELGEGSPAGSRSTRRRRPARCASLAPGARRSGARAHRRDAGRRPPRPEQLALARRLGLVRSVVVAALRAHGRTFGTLTLANAAGSRLFEAADVQLAEELALRAATAIDNARLYTERTPIADTLQAKLLPERLPAIPGALLAARYRAAGELNEVGGDFYDVFPRSPGEWAIVVGDVSGKGPEAAAVTALARHTLRAGAFEADEPAKALRRLNGAMRTHDDAGQFATAALAYVSDGGEGRLGIASVLAGHPPAMVVRRDGTVERAGSFGTMLALLAEPALTATEHHLGPGDVLLLFTDEASATSVGVTPGTATTMVKALAESGLAEYEPYSGVRLTGAGRARRPRAAPTSPRRAVSRAGDGHELGRGARRSRAARARRLGTARSSASTRCSAVRRTIRTAIRSRTPDGAIPTPRSRYACSPVRSAPRCA